MLTPAVGLLALIAVDSIRGPLAEREAPLGVAVRAAAASKTLADARLPRPAPLSIALASLGPRAFGGGELALRAAGLAAGAVALGATVRLGQRLFATRVGVLGALFLLATPAGRAALGTQLGADPFLLLAIAVCLSATRNLARSRRSLAHAGVAAGAAAALVGPAALWLPAATSTWLARLHGLDRRSLGRLLGWATATAILATLLAELALEAGVSDGLAALLVAPVPPVGPPLAELARSLLPLLPLAALGAWHLPPRWARSESLRFLAWWGTLSATSAALTGCTLGFTLAAFSLAAALAAWAFDRAPRGHSLAAAALGAAALSWLPALSPSARPSRLEAWAARETGRYLRHVVPRGSDVGALASAAGRLSFYGGRPVAPLSRTDPDLSSLDYVVLDAAALERLGAAIDEEHRAELPQGSLRVLAEFGPWVVARVDRPRGERSAGPRTPSGRGRIGGGFRRKIS